MFDPEFFPTPPGIAARMVAKLSKDSRHVLEPSAGKGDLAEAIKSCFDRGGFYGRRVEIECIESSPDLAAILTEKGFPVVGLDWLEYDGMSYYDAIVMNPPFSNGDAHLLKAWDFLHGGEIVCLLNAETVRNPHTATRRRLASIIAEHGEVESFGNCFAAAERRTDVEVVMVYLVKQSEDDRIDLWANETAEREASGELKDDSALAIIDRLGNMQHFYDKANEHMLQAFAHARKAALYLRANDIHVGAEYEKALEMALGNVNNARAEFLRRHRGDAWMSVLHKTDYHKWLDKKQKEELVRDAKQHGHIPFTRQNIKGTLENIFLQRGRLFEKSVANVFDELTRYFPGNTHHAGGATAGETGWKSNASYKVNKKLVFPYGCRYDGYGSYKSFSAYGQIEFYSDLDRILCVLDGKDFSNCYTIGGALKRAFDLFKFRGDNKCESEYFRIRFFKKGTVHLVWKDDMLWAAFNKAAAKGKAWIGEEHGRRAA